MKLRKTETIFGHPIETLGVQSKLIGAYLKN